MSDVLVTQCPGCGAKLKLKNKSAQGKKTRCPKCANVFVVNLEADAPASDEFDDFGAAADGNESLDPFDQPPRGRALPTPGKSLPARVKSKGGRAKRAPESGSASSPKAAATKEEGAGSGTNKVVLALIVVIGLGLIGGGIFAFTAMSRKGTGFLAKFADRSGEGIPSKYLPDGPECVIYVRVADLLASPAGKAALADEEFKKQIDMYSKAIGLQPEDVDTVTLAIAASPVMRGHKSGTALSQLKGMSGEDSGAQTRCLVIVRTKKPINKKAFADTFKVSGMTDQLGTAPVQFSGFRVFRRMENTGAAFPDPNTLLLGSVLTIDEVLANPSPSVPDLQEIDPKQQLVLAVLPPYWPKAENLIRLRDDGPTGKLIRLAAGFLLDNDFKLASVGLTLGKTVRVQMKCLCDSDASAKKEQKAIAAAIDSSQASGIDEAEVGAPMAKGKKEKQSTGHINPLCAPFLYDFRTAAGEETSSRKWADDAGSSTIQFTATLKGEDLQEQTGRLIRRLTFYQPKEDER